MLRVVYEGVDDAAVERMSLAHAARLVLEPAVCEGRAQVLGPAPCPIPRLQNRFRRHLIVKAPTDEAISSLMTAAAEAGDAHVRALVDRDPTALL